MPKFTLCIKKIKEGKYEIHSPGIGHIVIQAKTEEEGITEFKKRARKYLQEFPKDLEQFEKEIKHIRFKRKIN